ncbi:hypothetical protein [uncultured Devosia sp.]|uniref:hypothetical protein n=1 Tax=uncultured Devosia sp. TaxID=211434 RepID=UPI0035CBDC08
MLARAACHDSFDLRALVPALAFAVLSAGLALATTMAAPQTGEMAVVFPPFTDERTAWALVSQAGGLVVAPTRVPNVVVAYAPDPQFQSRIARLGALFFIAARGLCANLPQPLEPS